MPKIVQRWPRSTLWLGYIGIVVTVLLVRDFRR